ncbi:MAG TPA: endonuclease/exonuclease/phosphatase family protein [Ktedonobacterales bacterium]
MDVTERMDAPVARVMTWNVLAGGWPRLDAIEAVIRDARPDVIGMQEILPDALDALARRLDMRPLSAPSLSGRGSPVGLLSRWPARVAATHANVPLRNALLEAEIAPPGAPPIRVAVVHLAAAYSAWRAGEGVRLREIGLALARIAPEPDRQRLLLMGDFNSLAPGEDILAARLLLRAADNDAERAQGAELDGLPGLAKVLPPPLRPVGDALVAAARWAPVARLFDSATGVYIPRAVVATTRASGLVDLAAAVQPDPRLRPMTCPSDEPAGRIDYLFASPPLAKALLGCETLTDAPARPVTAASDHRPVLAALGLTS